MKHFRRRRLKSAAAVAIAAGAGILFSAEIARADRVLFHTGKAIEGVVQEEFPTRIKFLYQGRSIVIPRDRIANIEKDTGGGNVALLIERADAAIAAGKADEAQAILSKAWELNGESGPNADDLRGLESRVRQTMALGTAAERRAKAEQLLAEAVSYFDRIQIQKGREYLEQALKTDPELDAAHDQMAAYMQRNRPPITVAIEYFCDQVPNPDRLKPGHPVIGLLPQIFDEEVRAYRTAATPESIGLHTQRLQKIGAAFAKHPDWAASATTAQQGLIQQGPDGVIKDQVIADLDARRYPLAMNRLLAWKRADEDTATMTLYVRAWIGQGEINQATEMMKLAKELDPEASWVDRQINALTFYETAKKAMAENNHKDARAIFGRLFSVKDDLLPEIYDLIAQNKVGYDMSDLQSLEASDPTAAADLALTIYDYTVDAATADRALKAFQSVAPMIKYQLNLGWIVDGQEVALHKESSDFVIGVLGDRFALQFQDESPFILTARVYTNTFNNSGKMIAEGSAKPDPFVQDYVDPDDSVKSLKLEIIVSHRLAPALFSSTTEAATLPEGVTMGRKDPNGPTIFFDVPSLGAFDLFLKSDFPLYLPPDAATLSTLLNPGLK